MSTRIHRSNSGPMRWAEVEVRDYKRDGCAPFRDVSRQVLFDDPDLGCQLRYFEVAPGGYTTLERHVHAHAVVIQRGRGRCLVGSVVFDVVPHDLVHVPAYAWHQFRAVSDQPLGFLCMVNSVRDPPQLPTDDDFAALCADAAVAAFVVR